MNKVKIRTLIKIFENINIYDIEKALLIYEYVDKDINEMSDEEINSIYEFVKSRDKVIDEYVAEKIRNYDKQDNELEINK